MRRVRCAISCSTTMAQTTSQKCLVTVLKSNSTKIVENIRYSLKTLDQCSTNIVKARQGSNLANLLQQELVNGRNLIKSLEVNLQELEKIRSQLRDLGAATPQEYANIVQEVQRTTSSFIATNQEVSSNAIFVKPSQPDPESRQLLQTKVAEENVRLKTSRDRFDQVESINRDLIELNEIATHMSTMIHEQGEVVDNIESNVTSAESNVSEGTKSLIKASGYAGAMGPVTCAAIGGAVLGPIGAAVGLKIALVSAVGGSVLSYCGAKYVQTKNNEDAQVDMNAISTQPISE